MEVNGMLAVCKEEEPFKCRFEDLCEECYPEPDMVEYRKKCNSDNCDRCCHYWNFVEGYQELFEED